MNVFMHFPSALSSKAVGNDSGFAGLLTYSCLLAFPPYTIYIGSGVS